MQKTIAHAAAAAIIIISVSCEMSLFYSYEWRPT